MPRLRELRESIANPQSSVSKVESSIEAKVIETDTLESTPQKVDSSDIIFTDTKGKEHTLTKEVQQQWCETFNLKSLDESYIPQLSQELQEAIGKEIKLTKGSLYKIIEKGREQYIPQIKETLEKPQIVLQDESEFIFAKQIKDDLYLTSIGKDFDTHITIISNSPKTDKTIQIS
nr:PBECR2 nuclease fold domain-containing protein [Helicobacter cinaedi]